jgi:predicted DNA-binding protein (UPF0251 family)
MARPPQKRKMESPPLMMGYKPFGIPRQKLDKLELHFDEFEAINVSRPTLTRIYESARKAIAQALVEGKMIVIEGGNIEFEQHWFRCKCCYQLVKEGEKHVHQPDSDENDLLPIES